MKKVLFRLLFLALALTFLIPLALPKSYKIERSISIGTPNEMVFDTVADFRTWPEWSPWYLAEPEAKITQNGSPGVVGSSTQWNGEKIGSGVQTLIKVVQGEYLETLIKFSEPKVSVATSYWTFKGNGEETTVIWGLKGTLDYPLGRYLGLFMESQLGGDYEKGLASLKSLLEAQK